MIPRILLFLIPLTLFLGSIGWFSVVMAMEHSPRMDIREPALAGRWYPGNPGELRELIRGFLSKAPSRGLEGDLSAIIVPHAGYMFSGQVAAYAYSILEGKGFKRVVLIGPNHTGARFKGVSVDAISGYKTPLGIVPVDQAFATKLLKMNPQTTTVPQAHREEHSIEIQVPFLQMVLKDFEIVPIMMGEQDLKTCSDLAETLTRVLDGTRKTLILASTDLSHYHAGPRARELDMEFLKKVREFDPQGLAKSVSNGTCEACGAGPAIATMLGARALGAARSVILQYATSGDVTGDNRRVVGYLSAAMMGVEK